MKIKNLGNRICIIGPSCSGKSTLAEKLGKKLSIPVFHLDQIAHAPNTAWLRRPVQDFVDDHDVFISKAVWIVEGNYSICMPQRFAAATSVIWIDPHPIGFLLRYIWRCIKKDRNRSGRLSGATKEFNWELIKYTFVKYPQNRIKYRDLLENFTGVKIHIHSMHELNKYYKIWKI